MPGTVTALALVPTSNCSIRQDVGNSGGVALFDKILSSPAAIILSAIYHRCVRNRHENIGFEYGCIRSLGFTPRPWVAPRLATGHLPTKNCPMAPSHRAFDHWNQEHISIFSVLNAHHEADLQVGVAQSLAQERSDAS